MDPLARRLRADISVCLRPTDVTISMTNILIALVISALLSVRQRPLSLYEMIASVGGGLCCRR